MNNILGSLGLGSVTADPNSIPDGRYRGEIASSRVVLSKDGSKVLHVTGYKVTEGDHKGAENADFQQLGKDPVKDEAGNITSFTPTMTDTNKQWYKKRLVVDLGVPEAAVDSGTFDITNLVGKQVVFGLKRREGYLNISFVEQAAATATPAESPSSHTELL